MHAGKVKYACWETQTPARKCARDLNFGEFFGLNKAKEAT
jgi:hypothetical protein